MIKLPESLHCGREADVIGHLEPVKVYGVAFGQGSTLDGSNGLVKSRSRLAKIHQHEDIAARWQSIELSVDGEDRTVVISDRCWLFCRKLAEMFSAAISFPSSNHRSRN